MPCAMMTGAEFADLIERTGWSARAVAKRFGIAHGTIHDMKIGRMSVDPAIAGYLARIVGAIERIPLPDLGDRRRRD